MTPTREETSVVIIGGGVAGLTLATFLTGSGIPCVVLERQNRAYIEVRQRAGVVEARAVRMFERWELAERLLGGPVAQTIDYRVNGRSRLFELSGEDGSQGRFCSQQMLVGNLMRELIDTLHGDVRFDTRDVDIHNEGVSRPIVTYTDDHGTHELVCNHVAGCDGSRGVSRASIPPGALTEYTHEFGYAWLAALVEVPVIGHPIMGASDHGFVAQLPRGPHRSRYYLQVALGDGPDEWPDDRIWNEIRLRLHDETIENATVVDRDFVPLRSVVYAPMQYNHLYLAGDVAHLVPPTGAKGMNLALYDVDVLASAIVRAEQQNDSASLRDYSATVLPHIWKYQEFSVWMTETMHDAGAPGPHGEFRKKLALARLDALFDSPTAAHLHGAYQRGTA